MDAELHQHLVEIKTEAVRTRTIVEALEQNLQRHIDSDTAKFGDLYEKVNAGERFRSRVKGGILTLGGLSAMLAAWVNWDRLGG